MTMEAFANLAWTLGDPENSVPGDPAFCGFCSMWQVNQHIFSAGQQQKKTVFDQRFPLPLSSGSTTFF